MPSHSAALATSTHMLLATSQHSGWAGGTTSVYGQVISTKLQPGVSAWLISLITRSEYTKAAKRPGSASPEARRPPSSTRSHAASPPGGAMGTRRPSR